MNKSLRCSSWFFPELTQGTTTFCGLGLENKSSLYGGLCFFTETTVSTQPFHRDFFKALHKECLHTKCLLLTWTTQTSIISSVRKAEEICILFLLCKLCKHQHNPPRTTPTATAYLEAASKARIHLFFKSAHSLHTEPKCRNTEKQRGTS